MWEQIDGNDTMLTSSVKKAMYNMNILLASLFLFAGPTSAGGTQDDYSDNLINNKLPKAPTECLLADRSTPGYLKLDKKTQFKLEPGIRRSHTRSPVHTHPHAGATCVLQGEMTLMLEGEENKTFRGNLMEGLVECYQMPAPDTMHVNKMSAENTGSKPAIILDIFPVPSGEDRETFDAMCVLQNEGLPDSDCYQTGYVCE